MCIRYLVLGLTLIYGFVQGKNKLDRSSICRKVVWRYKTIGVYKTKFQLIFSQPLSASS